jgi:thioredoxin 1
MDLARKSFGLLYLPLLTGLVFGSGCAYNRSPSKSVAQGRKPASAGEGYAMAEGARASRPPNAAETAALRQPAAGAAVAPASYGEVLSSPRRLAGQIEHASQADFDQKVLRSDVPVLVDFYAEWCGPCKTLAPTLAELAQENPGVRVVKVNISENRELAERYRVKSIPALMVFKDGKLRDEHVGMASKTRLTQMLRL